MVDEDYKCPTSNMSILYICYSIDGEIGASVLGKCFVGVISREGE